MVRYEKHRLLIAGSHRRKRAPRSKPRSRTSTNRLVFAGLLVLVLGGGLALLRVFSKPTPTEAAPAPGPRVDAVSSASRTRPTVIFTGDLTDLSYNWQPLQIGSPMMHEAISAYFGLGPGDDSLRRVGPYPREQCRTIVEVWRTRMPDWRELQIGKITFMRREQGQIVWRAEDGLTVRTGSGAIYTLYRRGQWLRTNAWEAEPLAFRVSFTLRDHGGGFWPKREEMTNFESSQTSPNFDESSRRISLPAVSRNLAGFFGLMQNSNSIMTVAGMPADRAWRWINEWRTKYPTFDGMTLGGVTIWRNGPDDYAVELTGQTSVVTWDGSRYGISPDGRWQWLRPWQDVGRREVRIMWLRRDGRQIVPGPTATDSFREQSPWQLLGIY